ncbi:MAG: hypothetical protein F6J95_011375 [Leptolyngbya sp. SIO1E4]|nr:hypothetical protein [Leptolyngbya sp. SIO1E4]
MMKSHWLSWILLLLAYATFGRLLHSNEVSNLVWGSTLAFVVVKASVLTLAWTPIRKFVLLGFQSDVGYSIMVLVLASLAVLAVVQFRAFAYVIVLVAASILVRVDCLVDGMGDRISFLILILLPLMGLGVSWLPQLLYRGSELGG